MGNCHVLTDEAIITFAELCIDLRYLSLSNGKVFTDKSLLMLVENCKQLIEVKLYYCDHITVSSIEAISVKGKHLCVLIAYGCALLPYHIEFRPL